MMDINFLKANNVDVNKSLELFGDIETYNNTIGDFLIGAKDKLPKLEMYKNNKDMANYTIYAHSLKSDAKYFGFTRLAELAYEHEMKAKEGDFSYVYENFDILKQEANRMIEVVKRYLEQDSIEKPVESVTVTMSSQPIAPNAEVYTENTILVVDDSNIIRNFVSRIFKDNYKVGVAKDGQEAINLIQANSNNNTISAILLDLNMPNVDGFAVLEYMKGNNLFTKIPVSIISGDSSKETIDRAFTYQIVDMLGKPFNESDVKRVVEKTILYKQMN